MIRALGQRITVNMAGVAAASFVGVEEIATEDLIPGSNFEVQWTEAIFYGESALLGPMHVRLRPTATSPKTASGIVTSLAAEQPKVHPNQTFLPARNRNEFFWRITLPRYKAVLENPTPLINEAVITAFPPFNTEYQSVGPVKFRTNRARSGLLARNFVPDLTAESCRVKLQELRDLNSAVVVRSEDQDQVTFELMFRNESTEDRVTVVWMIWPPLEEASSAVQGTIALARMPASVSLKIPRDVFFQERFLVASIAQPFETKGAAVAKFPALA
jgi:hypothetical protein